jgi:serine/threonine protein phosphatase PrpC
MTLIVSTGADQSSHSDMAFAATQPSFRPGSDVTVYGKTDVGRVRTNNEDSFVVANLMWPEPVHAMTEPARLRIDERGVLLAVSDGMGGQQAGEVASALALSALQRNMARVNAESAEVALRASVELANKRVFDAAKGTGRQGMGATLTAILFHGLHAYIAEIGDSRAYLLRSGRLVPLTRDQSYVQHLLDAGGITREQADASELKNVILQAMGTKENVVVAMNRLSIRRGDRFLVCSDGLTGKVTDDELCRVLAAPTTVQVACDTLIAMALERGGEDNVTALVAELGGDGAPPLTDTDRISLDVVQAFVPGP